MAVRHRGGANVCIAGGSRGETGALLLSHGQARVVVVSATRTDCIAQQAEDTVLGRLSARRWAALSSGLERCGLGGLGGSCGS
jgi:hypothetical protein